MSDCAQQHRHCTLSLLPWSDAQAQFHRLTQGCPQQCLIVTHQASLDSPCPVIGFNGLKNVLGQTHRALLLDFSQGINLSALAILAGTIEGGGALILHLGEKWLDATDHELARFLPWPLTPEQQPSQYKHILWRALHESYSPFSEQWPTALSVSKAASHTNTLTQDQAHFIHSLFPLQASNHLLLAPRGRGKSYALGTLLAQCKTLDYNLMATASSPQNAITLKSAFEQTVSSECPFSAPDALLASDNYYDVLVVDEAASLPLPVLDRLKEKAKTVVFSSTDYGYEGSGRGFGLKFKALLHAQSKPLIEHTLSQPLRWAENDPFELWLNELLFVEYSFHQAHSQTPRVLQGAQWLDYPQLLDQAFALLVSAHYQTTPDNKRWLVDDPSVTCFLSYQHHQLVGVALVSEEGSLPDDLSEQVAQGKRRPRGHLLPQSLLAHEGIEDAGRYRYWRVSRIAVAPNVRQQGHGSRLLDDIYRKAQSEQIDFVCTSFGATTEVLTFWQKNHFVSVRLGTSQDQASGNYSLMMLRAVTGNSHRLTCHWQSLFARQWWLCKPLSLRELEAPLMALIEAEFPKGEHPPLFKLTDKDVSDLTYFCEHHRPYDTIRAPLLVFSKHLLTLHLLKPDRPDDALLLGCSRNTLIESDAKSLGYTGKKAFYQALKQVIRKHLFN